MPSREGKAILPSTVPSLPTASLPARDFSVVWCQTDIRRTISAGVASRRYIPFNDEVKDNLQESRNSQNGGRILPSVCSMAPQNGNLQSSGFYF